MSSRGHMLFSWRACSKGEPKTKRIEGLFFGIGRSSRVKERIRAEVELAEAAEAERWAPPAAAEVGQGSFVVGQERGGVP